jgi:hypothetical protein
MNFNQPITNGMTYSIATSVEYINIASTLTEPNSLLNEVWPSKERQRRFLMHYDAGRNDQAYPHFVLACS